jgi:ABC-type multidrug transport system fused ATPase/permease subunit
MRVLVSLLFPLFCPGVPVVAAPSSFFDSTPVGRLLNRFSRDVYSLDDSLPFQLNIFLAQTGGLLGTLCVIGYSTRGLFLAVLPLLAPIYYRLQVRYRGQVRGIFVVYKRASLHMLCKLSLFCPYS